MNEKREHRRLRLIELLQMTYNGARGYQTKAATRIGCDQNYLSRLLSPPDRSGHKNIGEEYRDRIEAGFELQPGWLDMPLGTEVIPRNTKTLAASKYVIENTQPHPAAREPMPATKDQDLENAIETLRSLNRDCQLQVIGMIRLLQHNARPTESSAGLRPPAQAA